MARGIEELAEMQVTGPVQGGDMVMKPDQAPVGAAALLSKMAKKNTPGIFKLPMPDKEMPNFMKVAAEGVEQQTAQGDTINIMAGELMRQGINIQGMGMDEIIKIYEETFGSPGDVDQFGISKVDPSDWRSILKMIQSGMSQEQIEEQVAMNTMKDRAHKDAAKVEAFAPEGHELAYITPDEQEMLKMMGGSGETNPMTGIKQYPGGYGTEDTPWGAGGTTSQPGAYSAGQKVSEGKNTVADVFNDPTSTTAEQVTALAQSGQSGAGDMIQGIINQEVANVQEKDKIETKKDGTGIVDFIQDITYRPYLDQMDAFAGGVADWEKEQVRKMLEKSKAGEANMGALMARMRDDPGRFKDWFAERGDIFDEVYEGETLDGEPIQVASDEAKFDYLVEKFTGNKNFEKNYNPQDYYKSKSGESSADYQRRMREKGVTSKELAQMQREGKLGTKGNPSGFTRANTQLIEEGRRRLEQERGDGGQDRHPGTGGPGEKKLSELVTEDIVSTTDPRAGQFSLGGTMPYTHDVATGGVEMDVPLGRRFAIDKGGKYRGTTGGMGLNEAMQYATLGGYGQLEPFQEYLTRRRKHLGEDEPRYFDEEGNVIFSGIE